MWCSSSPFLVFIIQATWWLSIFLSHIVFLNEISYCVFLGCSIWKTTVTLNCHTFSGKEPSLCREQVALGWVELPSLWKVLDKWLPWKWHDAHGAMWHNSLSVGVEGHYCPHVGRSHPHTMRVVLWAHWTVVLEVCCYWHKGWSIRYLVYFDE